MSTPYPKHPPPPQPTSVFFDPYNSTSTGHQRAESRISGSTSWRDLRTRRLAHQFKDTSGRGGHQHLSDLAGAGSENFGKDGHLATGDWDVAAPGLRGKGWQDIRDLMSGNRKRSRGALDDIDPGTKRPKSRGETPGQSEKDETLEPNPEDPSRSSSKQKRSEDVSTSQTETTQAQQLPQVFRNLTMYLNGSTAPLISDHKIKHIFAQHGGNTSIALGRRTVTHVILGNDLAGGGGLASSKIQKEVDLVRGLGKGVKYVTAQWIIDSVEKGIRQPESRYVPKRVEGKLGGSGQASVRRMFMPKTK